MLEPGTREGLSCEALEAFQETWFPRYAAYNEHWRSRLLERLPFTRILVTNGEPEYFDRNVTVDGYTYCDAILIVIRGDLTEEWRYTPLAHELVHLAQDCNANFEPKVEANETPWPHHDNWCSSGALELLEEVANHEPWALRKFCPGAPTVERMTR